MEERLQDAARRASRRGGSRLAPARAARGVQATRAPSFRVYPRGDGSLQLSQMALDRTRTLRGALAGDGRGGGVGRAAAARQAGVRRRLRRRRAAGQLGHARAGMAADRPRRCTWSTARCSARSTRTSPPACPGRGRRAACCSPWPSTSRRGRRRRSLERVHPAAGDFPQLWGNPRAFAQATSGATCCSASCSASSSGGSTRPPTPRRRRRRRRRLQRPRLGRAPRGRRRTGRLSRRVLITGASGFAGRHLVRALRRRGRRGHRRSRARAGCASTCSTPRRPRAAVARRAARRRLPPRRARPRRASRGRDPRRTCATTSR